MKCFYHEEKEAVGFCKYCGRAFCRECYKEIDGLLFCKNCAERARKYEEKEVRVVEVKREGKPERIERREAPEMERREKLRYETPAMERMEGTARAKQFDVKEAGVNVMVTPAVVGGLVLGLMMTIPIINLVFVLWPIGPIVALSFLLAELGKDATITKEHTIKLGVLTGTFATFFSGAAYFIVNSLAGESLSSMTQPLFQTYLGVDNTVLFLQIIGIDPSLDLLLLAARIILTLPIFILIGSIGAGIGMRILR